jgi:mevalonate kinase
MDGAAFGKLILFGEHAVVHGRPAIACALDRGAHARTLPGGPGLTLAGALIRPDDGSELGRALAALFAVVGRSARVEVECAIATRAGLGSSAAIAVAIARALEADEATVARAADAAERVFHGSPSGIDASAARQGGVGWFAREGGWRPLPAQPFVICVGLSGRPRSTAGPVAAVTRLHEANPLLCDNLFDAIACVVAAAEPALLAGDLALLGRLLDLNHYLLGALGVGVAETDSLCALARHAGALGAKLTGAGGGGAVIALAPGREDEVLAAWRGAGYHGFQTRVPCRQ